MKRSDGLEKRFFLHSVVYIISGGEYNGPQRVRTQIWPDKGGAILGYTIYKTMVLTSYIRETFELYMYMTL